MHGTYAEDSWLGQTFSDREDSQIPSPSNRLLRELTGEGSGSGIGEGGGYANGGGGGYVGENGQTPYVYTIGSYFPDRPVFFFP
jgi:hypothetical protein